MLSIGHMRNDTKFLFLGHHEKTYPMDQLLNAILNWPAGSREWIWTYIYSELPISYNNKQMFIKWWNLLSLAYVVPRGAK